MSLTVSTPMSRQNSRSFQGYSRHRTFSGTYWCEISYFSNTERRWGDLLQVGRGEKQRPTEKCKRIFFFFQCDKNSRIFNQFNQFRRPGPVWAFAIFTDNATEQWEFKYIHDLDKLISKFTDIQGNQGGVMGIGTLYVLATSKGMCCFTDNRSKAD
jgi:hypothetical protein